MKEFQYKLISSFTARPVVQIIQKAITVKASHVGLCCSETCEHIQIHSCKSIAQCELFGVCLSPLIPSHFEWALKAPFVRAKHCLRFFPGGEKA
jgi:hypothetical protein